MVARQLVEDGFAVVPYDAQVAHWAKAAAHQGQQVLAKGGEKRHGATWFVGVDALPNASDGGVAGVPLAGAWLRFVQPPATWHRAQLSVIYPGYPRQDLSESDAAHRFRKDRDAAHVDGLLPEGPHKRRHLREPHGFIAGFPLNDVSASPLVVWKGSHQMIRRAFQKTFAGYSPDQWGDLDVTDIYKATRKAVFSACDRITVQAKPGEVILLNRHIVHGVAPWGDDPASMPRMIAYFRPTVSAADWL